MIRWIIVLAFLALCAVIAQVWGGLQYYLLAY